MAYIFNSTPLLTSKKEKRSKRERNYLLLFKYKRRKKEIYKERKKKLELQKKSAGQMPHT